jgi:hypothetical protein
MTIKARAEIEIVPIVSMDAENSAMLSYAGSPQGRARIEKARQELRHGKGIVVTPAYFDDLNRRIAKRVAKKNSIDV